MNTIDKQFYDIIDELKDIYIRKNQNYASVDDPLSNLKQSEALGIPAWKGAMVRMGDKMSRLTELAKGKPDLVGESFTDTLRDLAIYAILCEILYKER